MGGATHPLNLHAFMEHTGTTSCPTVTVRFRKIPDTLDKA